MKKIFIIIFIYINNISADKALSCTDKCLIPLNKCIAKHQCLNGKKNYLACLKKNCYQATVNEALCKQKCPITCQEKCKLPIRKCLIKNNCLKAKNFKKCMFNNCSGIINKSKECITNCHTKK